MLRLICFALFFFLSFSVRAAEMILSSKAFAAKVPLPVLYTCDGKDISPDLTWTNLPPNTQSIAIILSDADAPTGIFYHWVLYNLPATIKELPQDIRFLPKGSMLGKNSFGNMHYNGPCPPKGSLHHYTFTVYALDKMLDTSILDAPMLLKTMEDHIIGQASTSTSYARWPT